MYWRRWRLIVAASNRRMIPREETTPRTRARQATEANGRGFTADEAERSTGQRGHPPPIVAGESESEFVGLSPTTPSHRKEVLVSRAMRCRGADLGAHES